MRSNLMTAALFALATAGAAWANGMIPGLMGTAFALTAQPGTISTADGNALHTWLLSAAGGMAQYPGPTLILSQGATVTVTLTNGLPEPTSLVFPGLGPVTAVGPRGGLVTREAGPGEVVSYSFVADRPGTYLYHSGTRPDVQVGMGLFGAIIVRPASFVAATTDMEGFIMDSSGQTAYGGPDSHYDREFLFLQSEMDPAMHDLIALGRGAEVDTSRFHPVLWFLNGRVGPDTMSDPMVPWLPSQPYNCMPMAYPGERVLLRILNAGRDLHPFHTHGQHQLLIARDGRMLSTDPAGAAPPADLAISDFTTSVPSGGTADAIYSWTGAGLGWDVYGHAPGDPLAPGEDPADHGKPLPVVLPDLKELTYGGHYSGSPFLGTMGYVNPGEGGLNPYAGFAYMWHSHNEKELTSFNIFPGGMFTMMMVIPPGVPMHMAH